MTPELSRLRVRLTETGLRPSSGVVDITDPGHAVPEGNGEQSVKHDLAAHLATVDPRARARIED